VISVRVFNASRRRAIANHETITLARGVLFSEKRKKAALNIIYIDDRAMIRLNSAYLRHRRTTDVLSFPLSEHPRALLEGEVYVNLDQARRQAKEHRVTLKNEAARLVIHGVLHLLEYDDARAEDRREMTRLEERYLQILEV
jgi:rRNA maturation RNase YbeY